jgi:HPt (histidine-containing phosphotransfer) domain-containing protein
MNTVIFKYNSRLDTIFLESIYENDHDYAATIFEQFLQSYPEQIEDVEKSFAQGNIDLFRRQIHKVKPTFSFVGLTGLTNKAEIIEKECTYITAIDAVSDLYHDFKNSLAELIPIVEGDLKRLNAYKS